jgi:hypothetical protein
MSYQNLPGELTVPVTWPVDLCHWGGCFRLFRDTVESKDNDGQSASNQVEIRLVASRIKYVKCPLCSEIFGWIPIIVTEALLLDFLEAHPGSWILELCMWRSDRIWRVLMMVYNTQNYWVYGLGPTSGIINNWKGQCFGNWACFCPQAKGGRHLLCWIL